MPLHRKRRRVWKGNRGGAFHVHTADDLEHRAAVLTAGMMNLKFHGNSLLQNQAKIIYIILLNFTKGIEA
jgi:hypothetical protein